MYVYKSYLNVYPNMIAQLKEFFGMDDLNLCYDEQRKTCPSYRPKLFVFLSIF